MSWLRRHVPLGTPLTLTSWQKVAIGTWRTAADASIYLMLEVNAEPALAYLATVANRSETRVTLTSFVGKVVAETLRRHPEVNCVLRFGRLYPKRTAHIRRAAIARLVPAAALLRRPRTILPPLRERHYRMRTWWRPVLQMLAATGRICARSPALGEGLWGRP